MKNYLFILEYDGTRYNGWQRLGDGDRTIQGKLEQVLSRMDGVPVQVIGAGRTDAGVHARGQAANAHLRSAMSVDEIRAYVDHYLPEDIRVLSVHEAEPRFHCRYQAVEKHYCYYVGTGEKASVFDRKYVCQLGVLPDLSEMRRAAEFLCGTHDFTSFCGNRHFKKSAVRTIYELDISFDEERELLKFSYRGDGFLQYMVRILTGTLLEVGLGKRGAETMPLLLAAKDRAQAGYTAPPHGLFLEQVKFRNEGEYDGTGTDQDRRDRHHH